MLTAPIGTVEWVEVVTGTKERLFELLQGYGKFDAEQIGDAVRVYAYR